MNEIATDWLPKEAFAESAVKSALADIVAGWSARWFAQGSPALSLVRRKESQFSTLQSLQIQGAIAAAEMSGPGKRRLLEAALDIDLAGQVLGEADHHLLDAFATQIAGDLVGRLDEAFGGESRENSAAQTDLALSIGDMLIVTFPAHVLVPKLKAQFGAPKRSSNAPRSRMEALKPTALVAEGLLGRAELAVNDLKGLSVGDVLILDRSLNEPIELRLAGSDRQIGRGRLVRNGNQVSIQF